MHHATKLKSSQTGFLNMTMSSLYSNGLHSRIKNQGSSEGKRGSNPELVIFNDLSVWSKTGVGNVDPGGPVSQQSLAPTLNKQTWTS